MPTTDELLSDIQPDAARRLVIAALTSFATRGYHATTTRDISTGSGMSPAALYVHYASKEDVLFHIGRFAHESALAAVREAAGPHGAPADRVRAIVRAFTVWHARHHLLARVAQYELGALSPDHHRAVAKVRRQTEHVLQAEIEQGAVSGDFDVPDVRNVTRAVLSLGIDVARWFRGGAGPTPEALGETYGELAVRMLRSTVDN